MADAAPSIHMWVKLTLDGSTELRGQCVRVISDTVIDVAVIDVAGRVVQGCTELTKSTGLADRATPGCWWMA